jgi:predicted Zn finger-like uncharacterized protein
MFTRCPQCKTVHELTASILSHSRGLVQCGRCERTFSALSFLFDEWPAGQAHGPAKEAGAVPPVLSKEGARREIPDSDDAESRDADDAVTGKSRLGWILGISLLALITVVNAVWTFRQPLEKNSYVNALTNDSSRSQPAAGGLLKDPAQIQLVSRDMHTHPTRSGILVLSLTFVNLAQQSQVYPDLMITLLDATNQPVAKRRFMPSDYLRRDADTTSGLSPDVYLPVLLELGDPGEQAVGFEIKFF